ncbi:MAG: hypothetical protein Q7S96_02335 [bacterium]|nr:hypothetical protein [bacterium]
MQDAPESYVDRRRPPLLEAMQAEGNVTPAEAHDLLERKGYFTAHPRPWELGFRDRGLGRGDFAVLDRFGDLVASTSSRADAELIIAAVNASKA